MTHGAKLGTFLVVVTIANAPRPVAAQWIVNGVPVCTATGDQLSPKSVPDGSGGVIITWADQRTGAFDIYVQHVRANGVIDPSWPANGVRLCNALNDQDSPAIVSDGAGGAIVTWQDARSGLSNHDIYAQHVKASGVVDPAWTVNGTKLCNAALDQLSPKVTTDGAGGAIVTWQDSRGASADIYAQHVLSTGTVDPAWTANGTLVCNAAGDQEYPRVISDNAHGAIVAWQDIRDGSNYYVYAQHVLASGTVGWTANGVRSSGAMLPGQPDDPWMVTDGAGGALITWTNGDVYAHHVLASGTLDAGWPANGVLVCSATDIQADPVLASDGSGGVIITWYDGRVGGLYFHDIYAQRVLASGVVDPAWTTDGVLMCNAAGSQDFPMISDDGAGGAVVTWEDTRDGPYLDIYAQHILPSGVVDPSWVPDGVLLSNADASQQAPVIVSDGAGGAIVAWHDYRTCCYSDIYAQRVYAGGNVGAGRGPMVIGGDDLDFHGYYSNGATQHGWRFIQSAFEFMYAPGCISYPGNDGSIAALGCTPSTSPNGGLDGGAGGAVYYAATVALGKSVAYYQEGTGIDAFFAALSSHSTHPAIIYVPSTLAGGGVKNCSGPPGDQCDCEALAKHAGELRAFVAQGGGLFVHTEAYNAQADGCLWIESVLPGLVMHPECDYPEVLTAVGHARFPGLVDDDVSDVCHATFTGNFHGLDVLVTDGGDPARVMTIGGICVPLVAVAEGGPRRAERLSLAPPWPNPSVRMTHVRFDLPAPAKVRVDVYDVVGRRVMTLVDGEAMSAGAHEVSWDGRDRTGQRAAGIYQVRVTVGAETAVRQVVVIR